MEVSPITPESLRPKWKDHDNGKQILDFGGYFISYNPHPTNGPYGVLGMIAAIVSGDDGYTERENPETAIVIENDLTVEPMGIVNRYLILDGDHREAYEKIGGNLEKLIAYFLANQDKKSRWSNDVK